MKTWLGTFGFSYVGAVFLLLLFVPNIVWSKHKPKDYTADGESKVLHAFEMCGQVAVTCISPISICVRRHRKADFLPPHACVWRCMNFGGHVILKVHRPCPIFTAVFAGSPLRVPPYLFSLFSASAFTGKISGC